ILSGYEGTARKNRTWVLPIGDDLSQARPLFQEFDAQYTYVCNLGSRFLFRTTKDAPRGKVIAVDLTQENLKVWDEVIPQSEDVLKSVSYLGGKLVCNYLHNAHSQSKIHSTSGVLEHEIQFPGLGVASGISGKHDREEGWYSFSSFTTPGEIYSVDLTTGTSSLRHRPSVDFNPSDFVATQVWYSSKDGTSVPMFLVRKKEVTPNGDLPVLLYGYGGFNIPLTPSFNVSTLVWLEMGGVYAMPNLRGGGEFGAEWHQAGTIHEKQNVFDDFIAAAEWLIDNNWTNSDRLAIRGGSNGGLLVGACMTQRPELFAACLPAVGVLDMLRYHLFTIGRAWASDYGTSEDPEQFKTLLAYSPYHNLEEGTAYPATLVTTGDHDDRVVPAHSFKFAAALQAAHQGEAPVLIRIETRGGHGAGKPTAMRIAEYADLWAFLSKHLGM
ncbi:MAG: prolyl oligopeptidase family serine peptidase, partial [Planctomycetes bacterium]|nr:prolyl oligopeptidase family serine peptidase [Planctomycetota bacterium]